MITLGKKVKDRITGFVGIATGRAVYLNDCVRVQVTPSKLKNPKAEPEWFDEEDLKEIGPGILTKPKKPTGGPRRYEPKKRRIK